MTKTRDILRLLIRPFEDFFRTQALGGTILGLATVAALGVANSPLQAGYHAAWATELTIGTDRFGLTKPLVTWVGDLLMAVFFLTVGLEIKRELLVGELNSLRKALVPTLAAVGGMIVPALLFLVIAPGPPASRGWGIPMAADIAFALGCLRLLGTRVPASLLVFLTALAIIDDLGAILVIAIFYATDVSFVALMFTGLFTTALVAMNLLGVRRPSLYVVMGLPLWVSILKAGIHPTIAGVIVGFCVPARARYSRDDVLEQARALIAFAESHTAKDETDEVLEALEHRLDDCQSPLSRLEEGLHPWVAFLIVPLFAFANAGVSLRGVTIQQLVAPSSLAIIVGLFVGNQVGVFGATYLAVKSGLAPMPTGCTWRQVYGMSVLAGIGFTMSLFISGLAYGETGLLHEQSKVAVLVGSLLSAATGLLVLYRRGPLPDEGTAAEHGAKSDFALGLAPSPREAQ